MSLNRWKVLACTLTVGVGGLAVFATDPAPGKTDAPKAPAPLPELTIKPPTPANGSDTAPPVIPVKGEEIELTIPIPPVPAKAEEPAKKPAVEPVFEPIAPPDLPVILPVKGEAADKGPKKAEPARKETAPPADVVPPAPAKTADKPEPPVVSVPDAPKPPAPAKVEAPKAPAPPPGIGVPEFQAPPADPVPPPAIKLAPPVPTPAPAPVQTLEPTPPAATPDAVKVPLTSGKTAESAKLKMLLRMGDGQPRFEIRNTVTTQLLLKVYGQKIEMQAPPDAKSSLAGVTAIGQVRFTAPGLEGTCDHLTILSGTGEVLLKGNIHLKTRHGRTWSEMTAEKMVYQIGTAGLSAPGTPRVTPASYIPD